MAKAKPKGKGMTTGQKVAIGVSVVAILGIVGYLLYSRNKKKKACLDAGGTWNAGTKSCDMPVPVEPPKVEKEVFETAYKNLLFDSGKATIKSSSFPSLDKVANVLTKNPAWKLNLVGHTDSQGDDTFNMNLSKARAEAVKQYLTGKGVGSERITATGKGETMPIADNNTAQGRQDNRRVEFNIVQA
jgi:OOP family OmpA-OmpF porin